MADSENTTEQEPLSPEQRLDALEKKVGSNKLMLFGLAVLLIIVISVSVTVVALGMSGGGDEDSGEAESLVQVQSDIEQLKEQLLTLDTKLAGFSATMQLQEVKLANSGNRVLQATMIEQEANYQTFLSALRSAIYDLAHMVPGSRAWFELYSDQIDSSIAHSQTRVEKLKKIETSDEKVDTFFEEF
jgi:flagellar biosynthesis chaperone FliJ